MFALAKPYGHYDALQCNEITLHYDTLWWRKPSPREETPWRAHAPLQNPVAQLRNTHNGNDNPNDNTWLRYATLWLHTLRCMMTTIMTHVCDV